MLGSCSDVCGPVMLVTCSREKRKKEKIQKAIESCRIDNIVAIIVLLLTISVSTTIASDVAIDAGFALSKIQGRAE